MAKKTQTNKEILDEAKKRFRIVSEYESTARANYAYDVKFANGDSSNNYQWDGAQEKEVMLTIPKIMQHCLQVINPARQNQSQIEIRPTGDGATYKSAEVREGMVRYIENISNAQAAYESAFDSMVIGGIGWWRVVTDYVDDGSMDQDIFIRRIANHMSVYMDPNITQYDASDSRYCFVVRDMTKEEFEESDYGDWDDVDDAASPLGEENDSDWEDEDTIRVAEYYRKVMVKDTLHILDSGHRVKESDIKEQEKLLKDNRQEGDESLLDTLKRHSVSKREIQKAKIEWYLIAGSKILKKLDVPGTYIPLVRCVGRETVIDGTLDRKGHVRQMIDAQRLYNVWTSSAVEYVALQSKIPFIGPAEGMSGNENYWDTANIDNYTVLTYNQYTQDGQKLDPPQRMAPPQMAPAYLSGLQIAKEEMMMASGQYQSTFGEQSNEISGKSIQERQRQGDTATYHFVAHFSQAIRYTGKIINEWIPLIYDTEREMMILQPDGSQKKIKIDPNLPQAHQAMQDEDDEDNFDPNEIAAAMNPAMGKYGVEADIGPSYGTQRQEAVNGLLQLSQQNKEIAPIIADLMLKNVDFPEADEAARRLKRMVPPKALGKNVPDPQIEQLQKILAAQHDQMMQAKQAAMDMQQKLWQAQSKAQLDNIKAAEENLQKQIDMYNAETNRIKAVGAIYPEGMQLILQDLINTVRQTDTNVAILQQRVQEQLMPGSDLHMQANEQAHQVNLQNSDQIHQQNMNAMDQQHQAQLQANQQDHQQDLQEGSQDHPSDMQEQAAQAAQQNQGNE